MGGPGHTVPGVPGVPGITVAGVAGLPGTTVGGIPGAPGITVSGVPGEPGMTVSDVPGVPGVGTHRVDDFVAVNFSGLDRLTAAATEPASSEIGLCNSISMGAPLSSKTSFLGVTST